MTANAFRPERPPPLNRIAAAQQHLAAAKALGADLTNALLAQMAELEESAAQVAALADAVAPGVRDEARRLADDLGQRAQRITAVLTRLRAA